MFAAAAPVLDWFSAAFAPRAPLPAPSAKARALVAEVLSEGGYIMENDPRTNLPEFHEAHQLRLLIEDQAWGVEFMVTRRGRQLLGG